MWALFFFQMFYKRMSTAEALQTHIKPCPILVKKISMNCLIFIFRYFISYFPPDIKEKKYRLLLIHPIDIY